MGKGKKKQANTKPTTPSIDSDDGGEELFTGWSFPDQPEHIIPALAQERTRDMVRALSSKVKPPLRPSTISYAVRSSPTAGMGLFATKPILTGDLIFSERPLVVVVASHTNKDLDQLEQCLRILWMRLPDQQGFQWATLHHPQSPTSPNPRPLHTILLLNGWGFDPYQGAPYHVGIFPTYARTNHSCAPNAQARFNHDTWALELRAVRPISAESEIFVSYTDVLQASADRQSALKTNYGFDCSCTICRQSKSNPQKIQESDARRAQIKAWKDQSTALSLGNSLIGSVNQAYDQWRYSDAFINHPTPLITSSITNIVTCAKEGLEPFSYPHLWILYKIYGVLGDEKNFKKWRRAFRDNFLSNVGQTVEYDEASKDIEDPTRWKEWNYWNRATELKQELTEKGSEHSSAIHQKWEKALLR